MARATKNAKVKVSFKGVEGKRALPDEGDHLATVEEVTKEKGPKADYLKWKFTLDDDAGTAYTNTSLTKESLWNLRGLLEALGVEIDEEDAMELDLAELPEMRCGLVISHEDYEGKPQARIVDFYAEDDAKEDKKDKKKGKKDDKKSSKKKKKTKDKLAKSDVEGMDRDELLELNTEHDLELDEDDYKDDKKGLKKLLAAVLEKLDEGDLLEDEAEGGDKLSRAEVEDMDSDALADVIKDNKLDVDLDDHSTLRKQIKAVLTALEAEDLLED
jgi:hypothetical protein